MSIDDAAVLGVVVIEEPKPASQRWEMSIAAAPSCFGWQGFAHDGPVRVTSALSALSNERMKQKNAPSGNAGTRKEGEREPASAKGGQHQEKETDFDNPDKQESTKTGKRSSAQKEESLRQVPEPEPTPATRHVEGAFGKEGETAAEEVEELQERKEQKRQERQDRKAP